MPTFDVRDHLLDDSCGVWSLQQCLRTHADTVHKCERCAVRAREGLLRDDDGSEDCSGVERALRPTGGARREARMIFFDQIRKARRSEDAIVTFHAPRRPADVRVGRVDAGTQLIRRDLLGAHRFVLGRRAWHRIA